MPSYNKVILMGNLTRDPEFKYLSSGDAVCNFDIAVNSKFKNKAGEQQEEVYYQKCVAWKKRAENIAEYCSKGDPIFVEGTLKTKKWTNDAGEERTNTEANITMVQFLGKKKQ